MNLTISSVRCALQVALLGAITPNLRAVNTQIKDHLMELYFYYEAAASEEEVDLSEIVATELLSDFIEIRVNVNRVILPIRQPIPEQELRIFHRSEK